MRLNYARRRAAVALSMAAAGLFLTGCGSSAPIANTPQGCDRVVDVVSDVQGELAGAKGEKALVNAMSRAGKASEELASLKGQVAPELEEVVSGLSQDYAALAKASKTMEPVQAAYSLTGLINTQIGFVADICGAELLAPQ